MYIMMNSSPDLLKRNDVTHSVRWRVVAHIAALPFLTGIMSLSVPILVVLIKSSRSHLIEENNDTSLPQKMLLPMMIWAVVFLPLFWLNWNSIVHRANGHTDKKKEPPDPSHENDATHVSLALVANLHNVTNGLLATFGAFNSFGLTFGALILISILGGIINSTASLLTEIDYSFRKHVEYYAGKGRFIKSLFYQPLIKWFYNYASVLGILLRETYPAINATIRCLIVTKFLQRMCVNSSLSPTVLNGINLAAVLLCYPASAYVLHYFDIAQLCDSLKQFDRAIPLENALSRSSSKVISAMGKTLNGKIFFNLLTKLHLSPESAVNIILFISSVAFAALAENGLCTYVSCDDASGIRAGQKALLMRYFVGEEKAISIGREIAPYFYLTASAVGFAGTFFKRPMLLLQESNTLNEGQVLPYHESKEDTLLIIEKQSEIVSLP